MSYELGRAQFILEADGDELLAEQAQIYNEVTKSAQKLTKELAKELKVRQSDIKNAASVIISDNKRIATETLNAEKAAATDRKRTTQEYIKANAEAYKQDLRNWNQLLKDRDAGLKREAVERKKTTQELLRINQQAYREEERARKEAERRNARPDTIGRFARGIPGDIATIAGFGAIASGAILIREALVGLTEATLNQESANRRFS
jgi:ABC-type transporter Mla subunit MlaD